MLASIQKISNITPIAGADKIVLAKVLGYNCIVEREKFQINDLVVFVAPDTVMPEDSRWEFLNKQSWRVKLMKMRGVYSQGLVLPLEIFPNIEPNKRVEGADVTVEVGVAKYEKPAPKNLDAKGHFPGWLKVTDEPRLLGVPNMLEQFRGKECVITLKMDGTSGTFFLNKGEFGVCSRRLELKDGNNPYWNAARDNLIEAKLRTFAGVLKLGNKLPEDPRIAIQAEIYGPGIQGNKMGVKQYMIAAFNLYNGDDMEYCHQSWLDAFCADYQILQVPVVWKGVFDFSLEQLQELANKQVYATNGTPAEGIVIRPMIEEVTPEGERLSAKVISEVFMAKYGE